MRNPPAGSTGADASEQPTRLAEVLAALSLVTDLARGRPQEEAIRACLLATALSQDLGLNSQERSDTFYTTLLRFVGCTATSHEYAKFLGGNDLTVRARGDLMDAADPREAMAFLWGLAGGSRFQRAERFARMVPVAKRVSSDGARADCEVGTALARRFDMDPGVITALSQAFARWDGKGEPRGLAGERIAMPVRVAAVAYTAVMFGAESGREAASAAIRRWSGKTLDPDIAGAFLRAPDTWFEAADADDAWTSVIAAEPGRLRTVSSRGLDDVVRGFADAVDLKSPYFHGHSAGVSRLASAAAGQMGLAEEDVTYLGHAGLLHDIGRVAVSTGIWEKRGALSLAEWEQVRLHPYHTERILLRAPCLATFATLAGMHHERLDGTGYHRGTTAPMTSMTVRVLAAADAYEAMRELRPHRPARDAKAAARELESRAGLGELFDPEASRAVIEAAGERPARRPERPAGLTDREVEVLRLLARGRSEKAIAAALFVSTATVHTHVSHIYGKAGVSTRAGAAMFAMEHDLVRLDID